MKKIVHLMLLTTVILTFGLIQTPNASAKDFAKELETVGLMNTYVDFLAHWIEVIEKPSNAIGFAQNSLKDLYLENNEAERVEQALTEALQIVRDRGARNAIRFTLAEYYQNMGQAKKASEQYIKIIEENAGGTVKTKKSVFE